MSSGDNHPDFAAIQEHLRRVQLDAFVARVRWGEQGPPVNTLTKGKRIVSSYHQILTLPGDATYHDFLGFYIKHALGEDWWSEQSKVPDADAHQIIRWQRKVQAFQLKHMTRDHLNSAPGKGVTAHYYRVAFNLHTLHHQGLVQDRLIKRLKNRGNFQGALYETAVCAALVRAGFDVHLEDESKSPHKVCEFVATHQRTGVAYSVEAKSRHIPGVLGHPETAPRASKKEPRVSSLIKDALKKVATHPLVVWIDVNFPHAPGDKAPTTWGPVVREQIDALEAQGRGPAIVVFTNSPYHYLGDDELTRGAEFLIMGLNEPRFEPHIQGSVGQNFPGLVRAANTFGIPIPSQWD